MIGATARGVLPPWVGEGFMKHYSSSPHSARSQVLAQLRTLRANIAQARDALMHFKADRLDRDKLEPAARRVDDLMDMYAGNSRDSVQGCLWVTEIQEGIELVTNPKAADSLRTARADITALLEALQSEE